MTDTKAVEFGDHTAIVVFGASGDLAKKKTFPALFGLYREGYLSNKVKIIGYARSKLEDKEFKDRLVGYFKTKSKGDEEKVQEFLKLCSYISAPYDKPDGYEKLNETINEFEEKNNVKQSHRLFYLALPPSVFIPVATEVKKYVHPGSKGIARIIVEKPFGHDLQSAEELLNALKPIWKEEEMFRIDHYLGKEMVKNLLAFRFGNAFINASWDNRHISCIQISFKEPFGTEGRGGYFDSIGIIRDVIQNHLLQVLTLLTMERPVSNDPESVRDEKVRILKSISELDLNDVLVGQYGKSEDGKKPAYVDDETVKPGSKCVTFAAIGLRINTERWEGVPIILRAGKALNEGKVEIRVQYKQSTGFLNDIQRNELVIRVQPNEAMYMKLNSKVPGVSQKTTVTELDLTYKDRYENFYIPEAYESLIRDAMKGDHSNFVRDDELIQSWKIFTPLLYHLEGPDAPAPEIYPYGSRGPASLTKFLQDHDYFFESRDNYQWPVTRPDVLGKM
ncbi:BA75_02877T0 [Komagataella pastoris]|uniref:Glucose-6-phosphate 1-dehydrogenase n=1 Tax=Komagataella pastoris TaxID=4922 RepID=A0A1B2JCX6_PICPA|nr:BA75_02877T0 [Komagataella pastoris]